MANKYCNIDGGKPVKDEYGKIGTGFAAVEVDINALDADMQSQIDAVNAELDADEANLDAHKTSSVAHNADAIVFTPGTSGLVSVKASDAIKEVNTRVTTIITTPVSGAAATQEIVDARTSTAKSKTFASLDGRFEELEDDTYSNKMSTPTDYTATIIPIPNTAFMGRLVLSVKGRTSDTTTVTTDFNNISTGGSGDALNATMKLYKGSVDPLALPVPTDALWQQITDVSKLKTQNETPITSTNTVGRTAVYNGKTLVVQSASQPAVRDDFAGKVAGSTVVCPNKVYRVVNASFTELQIPSVLGVPSYEGSVGLYGDLSALGGAVGFVSTSINSAIAQTLFSFDLIRIVEDKYGTIPSADQTVAGKVAWLSANLSRNTKLNWSGYGSCPAVGNFAQLYLWSNYSGAWLTSGAKINNAGTVNTISYGLGTHLEDTQIGRVIDANGFIHLLAFTNASDGVTASTIYTDYINIELQFKPVVGYDLLVDSNPRRDSGMADMVNLQKVFANITDDFTGKVAGDNTVCANVAKYAYATSLSLPSAFVTELIDGDVWNGYERIKTLNGTIGIATTSVNAYIAQQLFSFNLIRMFKDANGYDIPIDYTGVPATDLANQVQWLKDNVNSGGISVSWTGFGSCPSGNKAYLNVWNGSWTGSGQHTASTPTILNRTDNPSLIDTNGFMHYLTYTDASNGTIASTINTDYIKLNLTFKNPNNAMLMFTNASVELENLTNGKSEALLVELDLSTICTNLFGGDNAKMKSALKSIQVDAWAMGSGTLAGALKNECDTRLWTADIYNTWSGTIRNNLTSAITQITDTRTFAGNLNITNANKMYSIIYAPYPSDGIIPSQVSLDYIKTTVSLTRVLSESAYKVRSVGKNLFDGKYQSNIYISSTSPTYGAFATNTSSRTSNKIRCYAGKTYTVSGGNRNVWRFEDSNGNLVGYNLTQTATTPVGAYFMYAYYSVDGLQSNIQIEEGSVATTYEPYKESYGYTPPVELRSVGSVTDTNDLNSGLSTKRVEQKVLQASDVTSMSTTQTNVDYALITKPTDYIQYGKDLTSIGDSFALEGYNTNIVSVGDNVSDIGYIGSRSTTLFKLAVAKGTTLAQAQTALTGKKLTYVLTTPVTTQYDAQIIDAYPSGTVYCEPAIRDTFKYTTKVDIANTLYPIKALTKVYKVVSNAGEEVVMTPIDLATCTVAGDGLSFTSTALALNDIVEYEYECEAWRILIPTLNLSYPNNLRGVVDGLVTQTIGLDSKIENLEHFTVAMLINHELRLVAHSI